MVSVPGHQGEAWEEEGVKKSKLWQEGVVDVSLGVDGWNIIVSGNVSTWTDGQMDGSGEGTSNNKMPIYYLPLPWPPSTTRLESLGLGESRDQ